MFFGVHAQEICYLGNRVRYHGSDQGPRVVAGDVCRALGVPGRRIKGLIDDLPHEYTRSGHVIAKKTTRDGQTWYADEFVWTLNPDGVRRL